MVLVCTRPVHSYCRTNMIRARCRPHEVEIKISHCGVCHSDIHLIDNDWGISKYPFIPGHEIVGTVAAVGSAVKDRTVGERVGVGWQADSCGICEWCRQGDEHLCAKSQPTCVGRNGGFADKIRVNSRFAIPVPPALESENVGSADVRRDYGVQPAAEPWGAAVVACGSDRNWRTGASGDSVCEGVWRGGDGVFDLEGQRGGGARRWGRTTL